MDESFAQKVAKVQYDFERETNIRLDIISGFRDAEKQAELIEMGTGAPVNLSNHTLCPAHAVDVWPATLPTAMVKATLGRIVVFNGLRWGGCNPGTPGCFDESGIAKDWNHIDDGPASLKARP